MNIEYYPLTPDRWEDFTELFGPKGACAGCWCMWWRQTSAEFEDMKGEANREAMKRLVESGKEPGILAYDGEKAIGWCASGFRESYGRLARSRILKPVDDEPVWSVVCFFVGKRWRRKGVTVGLLEATVKHAAEEGAKIVEGYPIDPVKKSYPSVYAFTGLAAAFSRAGFFEVARRSDTRPIMRRQI